MSSKAVAEKGGAPLSVRDGLRDFSVRIIKDVIESKKDLIAHSLSKMESDTKPFQTSLAPIRGGNYVLRYLVRIDKVDPARTRGGVSAHDLTTDELEARLKSV